MPGRRPDGPDTPHAWFDWSWFEDWQPLPSPTKPPPTDKGLRRKARQTEKSLGVKFLGTNPKTTLAGLASFGTLYATALAMILRDPLHVDPLLILGLLGSALAQAVGFLLAQDRPAPTPTGPPPTADPDTDDVT